MKSTTATLRESYADGYEIVATGKCDNPNRRDGRWPVVYEPRSSTDKSPWVRADGFPFRHSGDELKAVRPAHREAVRIKTLPPASRWESVTA